MKKQSNSCQSHEIKKPTAPPPAGLDVNISISTHESTMQLSISRDVFRGVLLGDILQLDYDDNEYWRRQITRFKFDYIRLTCGKENLIFKYTGYHSGTRRKWKNAGFTPYLRVFLSKKIK